MFAETLVETN